MQTTEMKNLTTLTVNGKEYAAVKGNMSDAAFRSMVVRNDMTKEKVVSFMAHLEREGLTK